MDKVVTSAACFIPPESEWPQIQAIRSKHDKAYDRWMPHINLLYPFLPDTQFSGSAEKAKAALKNFSPFTLKFRSFSFFEHGPRSCTVFLQPETEPSNALQDLQSLLQGAFPNCTDLSERGNGKFHGHLTVAQFPGKVQTEKKIKEFMATFKPFSIRVDKIAFISRQGMKPFEVRHWIQFGNQAVVTPSATSAASNFPPLRSSLSSSRAKGPASQPPPAVPVPGPVAPVLASSSDALWAEIPLMGFSSDEIRPPQPVVATPPPAAAPASTAPNPVVRPVAPKAPKKSRNIILPEGTMGLVMQRYLTWADRQPATNRPKTKTKLAAVIKPLCRVKNTPVSADEVIEKFKNEGFLSVQADGELQYPNKSATRVVVRPRDPFLYARDLKQEALDKCYAWIKSPNNTPKSMEALKRCIDQLVEVKQDLETDAVINSLVQLRLLEIDSYDNLTYRD